MPGKHTGWLGPMLPYADLPAWKDNRDNVGVRLVNAGWNALFTDDLDDITFRNLARDFGAAPQTLYHYCPSVKALGAELADHAVNKLCNALEQCIADTYPVDHAGWIALSRKLLTAYLAFAALRPRHYLLIFSPRYASKYEFPVLDRGRRYLLEIMKGLLEREAQRAVTDAEAHAFVALLHGSASLVAAGHPPQTVQLFRTLDVFVEELQSTAVDPSAQAEPSGTPAPTTENAPASTGAPTPAAAPASVTRIPESETPATTSDPDSGSPPRPDD